MSNKLKISFFIISISFFGIGVFYQFDVGLPLHEHFSTVPNDTLSWATFKTGAWQKRIERIVETRIHFRSFLTRKRNELVYRFFGASLNNSVIATSSGSLHRIPYLSVLWFPPYSKEELLGWERNFSQLEEQLKKKKMKLYLVIAPSSENFHQSGLPSELRVFSRIKRLAQLKLAVKNRENLILVDPEIEFRKLKDPEKFYYYKDYHWNLWGALLITKSLFESISNKKLDAQDPSLADWVKPAKFNDHYTLQLLALDGAISEKGFKKSKDTEQFPMPLKIQEPSLFVGDSFSQGPAEWFETFFADYYWQMDFAFNFNVPESQKKNWTNVIAFMSEQKLTYMSSEHFYNSMRNIITQTK